MVIAVRFALRVPAGNTRGPQYMDQALAAMHQGNPGRVPFRLEMCLNRGEVTLAFDVPEELRAIVSSQLYAAYPEARLDVIDGTQATEAHTVATDLQLTPDIFPIKRYVLFEDALNRVSADPLTALFLALTSPRHARLDPRIVLEVSPASYGRRREALRTLRRLASPFFRRHHRLAHWYAVWATSSQWHRRAVARPLGRLGRRAEHPERDLTTSPSRQHDREDEVQAAADKVGKHLFEVRLRLTVSTPQEGNEGAQAKLRELAGAFGQFSVPRLACFHPVPGGRRPRRGFLLSTEELGTLWHPATQTVQAPSLSAVESRELPPPVDLPSRERDPALAILGLAVYRGRRQRFGILPDDRRRHLALVGKTGQGKTTLLERLIASDIHAGRGVALLDPHGDLCDAVLRSIPSARTNDVILFDASDRMHPLSFNLLHCPSPEMRPLVASGILSTFKKLYGDFWGPRMEHILRNALLALLETPGTTLLSLLRLLSDAKYRQPLVARLRDPVVREFWQKEFASLPMKFQLEAVAPIQNKVGHFVSSPLLRNILGQPRSTLDLRQVLDRGQVLLVNLSKGRLGDDVSALLGSFLITAIQLAAMSRADVAEEQRSDFFLYVDEFQNFATESFATILSEARKYRLALTLANQYLGQLDPATSDALFGNVGTLVSFQVGATDAEPIATQFGDELTPQDLLRLPRYAAYIRLLIDGQPSRPFSMQTLPPRTVLDPRRAEIIRSVSRRRYTRPIALVEEDIAAALAT